MSKVITCSIDLNKIDKTKIKPHANGAKYYSFVVDENQTPDKFGNTHSVYDNQTKEERAAKVKKNYLGNGKVFEFGTRPATQTAPQTNPSPETIDDLPF